MIFAIEEHFDEFSSQLGQETIAVLNSEVLALENKFMVFESCFESKLNEPKNLSHPASVLPSINNLSLSEEII